MAGRGAAPPRAPGARPCWRCDRCHRPPPFVPCRTRALTPGSRFWAMRRGKRRWGGGGCARRIPRRVLVPGGSAWDPPPPPGPPPPAGGEVCGEVSPPGRPSAGSRGFGCSGLRRGGSRDCFLFPAGGGEVGPCVSPWIPACRTRTGRRARPVPHLPGPGSRGPARPRSQMALYPFPQAGPSLQAQRMASGLPVRLRLGCDLRGLRPSSLRGQSRPSFLLPPFGGSGMCSQHTFPARLACSGRCLCPRRAAWSLRGSFPREGRRRAVCEACEEDSARVPWGGPCTPGDALHPEEVAPLWGSSCLLRMLFQNLLSLGRERGAFRLCSPCPRGAAPVPVPGSGFREEEGFSLLLAQIGVEPPAPF